MSVGSSMVADTVEDLSQWGVETEQPWGWQGRFGSGGFWVSLEVPALPMTAYSLLSMAEAFPGRG